MLCSPFAGIVQVIVDPQQQPEIAAKAERLRRWDIAWGLGGAAVAAAVLGCGAGRCCSSPGEHLGGPPRCCNSPMRSRLQSTFIVIFAASTWWPSAARCGGGRIPTQSSRPEPSRSLPAASRQGPVHDCDLHAVSRAAGSACQPVKAAVSVPAVPSSLYLSHLLLCLPLPPTAPGA